MGQRHETVEDAGQNAASGTLRRGAIAGSSTIYSGGNRVLRRIARTTEFRERGDDRAHGLIDRHSSSRRKRGSRAPDHAVIVGDRASRSGHRSRAFAAPDGWSASDSAARQPAEGHGEAGTAGAPHEKKWAAAHRVF